MTHRRSRYLSGQLSDALSWSKTVSLVGMRQVGKTTLIQALAGTYVSLDDDRSLLPLQMGEWSGIEAAEPPVAIDECQKLPALFDRVKWIVDARKKSGQFILTGSVRFLSKRQIRESLTGRTLTMELLPFVLAESHGLPQFDLVESVRAQASPEKWVESIEGRGWCTSSQIESQIRLGGLPGICFKRDARVRAQLMEAHLETLLSRDIQFLYPTRLISRKLREVLRQIALQQCMSFNEARCARIIGTTPPTLRNILNAMEGLYLIRPHGKGYFLEDSGMAEHLVSGEGGLSERQRSTGFLWREIFALLSYRYRGLFELGEYRTRGGAEVPIVLTARTGRPGEPAVQIGMTADPEDQASDKSLKSLGSLLEKAKIALSDLRPWRETPVSQQFRDSLCSDPCSFVTVFYEA